MHHHHNLIVGRDRAHVKNLLDQFPQAEVVSASAFFDKVRILAFIDDEKRKRDDHAPVLFAQSILSEQKESLRYAGHFASLYSACFHGTMSPQEVEQSIGDTAHSFSSVINILARIDEKMDKTHLVNGVSALYRSWQVIKHKKIIPPDLYHCQVHLLHLIDLTSLEIEIIKSLSRLGIVFDVRFPLDFQNRGINVAVDFCARQFESEADLVNIELSFENILEPGPLKSLTEDLFKENPSITLSSDHCTIAIAENISLEADLVAKKIATILMKCPDVTIAVAMRTMDARSEIYKQALIGYGISVKDRKGLSLLKTAAGLLLESILSAKMQSLPKVEFIGLLNHPQFSLAVLDPLLRCSLLKLVNELGIDDRIILSTTPTLRYRSRLLRYKKIITTDHPLVAAVEFLISWLDKLDALLLPLLSYNSFSGHLSSLLTVIEQSLVGEDPSISAIKNILKSFQKSAAIKTNDPIISLNDFVTFTKAELQKITVPRPEHVHHDAVSFLPLPELLSSRFDHVFIVDIAFGRMPQNTPIHPLISDAERRVINKLLGKNLFRIYQDDPFEPMPTPPRQALEPFWFASAIASAEKSVHFSYATHDEQNQEQAASDFFNWLNVHINRTENSKNSDEDPEIISKQYDRFLAGINEKSQPTDHKNEMLVALRSRERAFFHNETSEHAFYFGTSIAEIFFGNKNTKFTKVLAPTMVEAFAQCRFRGFSERILDVKGEIKDFDDIDTRTIGQIAHQSLEKFFACTSSETSATTGVPSRLPQVLKETINEYVSRNYVASELVLSCHEEWLKEALTRLIDHFHDEKNISSEIVGREISFGLLKSQYPPLEISLNDRSYLIGGRVDRIDRIGDNFLIIDYKMSSIDRLKASMNEKEMLATNFQTPIYVRLVARHFARDNVNKTAFLFASIRDGEMLPPLSQQKNASLYQRIFDDHQQNSLAQEIDRIFSPIITGNITANVGEHCARCDLTFFCRRKEVEKNV